MPAFIKYVIIIAVILLVAFLSQQAITNNFAGPTVSSIGSKAQAFLSKGYNTVAKSTVDKVGGEVAGGGEVIKQDLEEKKNNIAENISTKVSNYFSGVGNALAGKSPADNCPPLMSTTAPSK